MSYMDDSCDPFGVPYFNTGNNYEYEEEKEYTLKELKELRQKKIVLEDDLYIIKQDIDTAKEQLKEKICNYVSSGAEIEFDEHTNCKIITKRFKLSQLENLKNDFDLKDIEVKCDKVKGLGDNYENKIIITLKS